MVNKFMAVKLKQSRNKELNKIIAQIKEGYKPERIILFGSYAYGRPKENSDVDLVIIKKTKMRPLQRMMRTAKLIKSSLGADVLVYTPKEWEDALNEQNYFIEEIARRGKIIYARE